MSLDLERLASQPFKLGDFVVDAKRGEIRQAQEVIDIEPKVMLVLLHLTANSGTVVDQEILFRYVWPQSVYSPNSIRRCISTLRKALKDDAKQLISTHAKVGYSINILPTFINAQTSAHRKNNSSIWIVASILFLLSIGIYWQIIPSTQQQLLNVTGLQPITATEVIEDFIAVSPDESLLAFSRYPQRGLDEGELWIKDLNSSTETKLNLPLAHRRNLAWSIDGTSLYYAYIGDKAWQIKEFSLTKKALMESNSEVLKERLVVENNGDQPSRWIGSIHPSPDKKLYFVASDSSTRHVYEHDIATNSSSKLMVSNTDFKPYELALSKSGKILAVSGQLENGRNAIRLLSLELTNKGQVLHSILLRDQQRVSVEWLNGDSGLLLNDGSQLFYTFIDENSNGFTHSIPSQLNFQQSHFLRFAKVGPKSGDIYFIESRLDHDLMLFDLTSQTIKGAIDSTAMDYFPVFSPNERHIAFFSTRYGKPQLFLHELASGTDTQLFENPNDYLNVDHVAWSKSGGKLAFSMGYSVHVILNPKAPAKTKVNVLETVQGIALAWYPNERDILLEKQIGERKQLVKLNSETLDLEIITEFSKGRASLSQEGNLLLVKDDAIYEWHESEGFKHKQSFSKPITRSVASEKGIYLQFSGEESTWSFWSFDTSIVESQFELPIKERVAEFNTLGNKALVSRGHTEREIAKISISKGDP
ncbi:winged helix-turn-helix domain-containing protein [Psychrosphaera ytuae]|uniref:Winged helix-turn-helix domain-containing protein n=1 Tax=Psychrosphaera ytuae TaxID=2820710 RepID=A0A975DDE3_9GAMM|nr:winged helix-turn-helix domain-containing protein [Psychrosphaera ytuae]QTH65046.1 winged helix-turn-helix domain-containing protein [Psychrosphaera ytuae]